MPREKGNNKRSFSELFDKTDSSKNVSEEPPSPSRKAPRPELQLSSIPKLSRDAILDKVREDLKALSNLVKTLGEQVGGVNKGIADIKGAEARIKDSVNKTTDRKLEKADYTTSTAVYDALLLIKGKLCNQEKACSGLEDRIIVLEKKEPTEGDLLEDTGNPKVLKRKVRKLTEQVNTEVSRLDLRIDLNDRVVDTLSEKIIVKATTKGEHFNEALCNQFVNATALKFEVKKVEEAFKVEFNKLPETINKNPNLVACEATVLTHSNNIRATEQRTVRQHTEQLDVNSAHFNKIGNVGKDIDNVNRSAAAFTTSTTEKLGQQQASFSLLVDELEAASPVIFRAVTPNLKADSPSTPQSPKHRESSSEDSEAGQRELSILGICSGGDTGGD